MNALELRTVLSVFATALVFGCSPQALPDNNDPGDLPDEDLPALGDDDDATEAQSDDDDATEAQSDDDDATEEPVTDDDDATDDPLLAACEDAWEENDTAELAASLGAGAYTGMTVCEGDDDFYAVALLAGDHLTIDLTFVDEDGDIDVQLQDASGAWVASGASSTDDEHVEADLTEDGIYFLRVYRFGTVGEASQDYGMELTVGEAPEPVACPLDPWEDNDTEAEAAEVTTGSYPAASVCTDDADWYAIDALDAQRLTVDLLFVDAEGDVDLRIVAPDGTSTNAMSVTDDETLTVEATVAGTYLIRTNLWADAGDEYGNTYDLNVSLQ